MHYVKIIVLHYQVTCIPFVDCLRLNGLFGLISMQVQLMNLKHQPGNPFLMLHCIITWLYFVHDLGWETVAMF